MLEVSRHRHPRYISYSVDSRYLDPGAAEAELSSAILLTADGAGGRRRKMRICFSHEAARAEAVNMQRGRAEGV